MPERLAAWFVTGPLGHLASAVADWAVLIRRALARRFSVILDQVLRRSGR
jgi:hypothetical protein